MHTAPTVCSSKNSNLNERTCEQRRSRLYSLDRTNMCNVHCAHQIGTNFWIRGTHYLRRGDERKKRNDLSKQQKQRARTHGSMRHNEEKKFKPETFYGKEMIFKGDSVLFTADTFKRPLSQRQRRESAQCAHTCVFRISFYFHFFFVSTNKLNRMKPRHMDA